jgi:hypothetical protein
LLFQPDLNGLPVAGFNRLKTMRQDRAVADFQMVEQVVFLSFDKPGGFA